MHNYRGLPRWVINSVSSSHSYAVLLLDFNSFACGNLSLCVRVIVVIDVDVGVSLVFWVGYSVTGRCSVSLGVCV